MPLITRLVAGKKNPSRVNLYLDGIFSFALSLDEVVKNGLKKGIELTEAQIQSLKKADEINWVYTKILNYLSYRPHSEFEVKQRLKKYGITETEHLTLVLNKLIEHGYLSDYEFAHWFVESRLRSRPRSTCHLTAELLAKGIDHSVIKMALKDQDETTSLSTLIAKKSALSRDKLIQFLLRRGFPYTRVKAKLDELGIKG